MATPDDDDAVSNSDLQGQMTRIEGRVSKATVKYEDDDMRRVTNSDLQRQMARIEGRIEHNTNRLAKLDPIMPKLERLADASDIIIGLANEAKDRETAKLVIRQWIKWDRGLRTLVKMIVGAVIVAVFTIIVYSLFSLRPAIHAPLSLPTPTAISTQATPSAFSSTPTAIP